MSEPSLNQTDPLRDAGQVRPPAPQAGRYSSFVSFMKIALPILAVCLIASVFVVTGLFDEREKLAITFEEVTEVTDDLRMVNPRINGTDAKGRPFVLTANSAKQAEDNPDRISFTAIEGDMQIDNSDGWLSVNAGRGLLRVDANSLLLYEGVDVFSTWGYEFHGRSVRLNLKTGDMKSDHPVFGQGPLGLLEAQKMRTSNADNKVIFHDGVKLTIFDGAGASANTTSSVSGGDAAPASDLNATGVSP